ncbi:MAG TPA: hypothetical protein VJJ48_00030, partial [Candidatus Paceibacterota bacterium]
TDLSGLVPDKSVQSDLFSLSSLLVSKRGGVEDWNDVFKTVDKLDRRYGSHTVTLGSSLEAFKRRGVRHYRRLEIPYMGEVV